jgi:hypothetical protein
VSSSAYLELLTEFALRWQAGQVPDLFSGLGDLDRQIEAQLKGTAGSLPDRSSAAGPSPHERPTTEVGSAHA